MNEQQITDKLVNYLKERKDMGPIIALLLQFLPQLLASILKKDKFANLKGWETPGDALLALLEDPTVKAKLDKFAASYDRVQAAMAAEGK